MDKRLLELDVFRGIAALGVMFYHFTLHRENAGTPAGEAPFQFLAGRYGVQLFFMISGFVIYLTLERVKRPLDFVVSRTSRLFPAYWAAILMTTAAAWLLPSSSPPPGATQVLANLTMLQWWFHVPHIDDVYWTLTVELSFYAVMFCLYRINGLKHFEQIAPFWLALQLLNHWLPVLVHQKIPDKINMALALSYASLFTAGILFYKAKTGGFSRRRIILLLWCLANQWVTAGDNSAFLVTAYFVIFSLFVQDRLAGINAQPLVFLGSISYALYLLHERIGVTIMQALQRHGTGWFAQFSVAVLVSLALATFITFAVERPAMNAIRQWYRQRQSVAPIPAGKST